MKIKKILGKFILLLSATTIILGPASTLGVGLEEMPESMKNLR
ncbi:hypothetical protein [uncultured Clostridium sp.]|nr:hypothetical protein [uncultured Clostridium sp.]